MEEYNLHDIEASVQNAVQKMDALVEQHDKIVNAQSQVVQATKIQGWIGCNDAYFKGFELLIERRKRLDLKVRKVEAMSQGYMGLALFFPATFMLFFVLPVLTAHKNIFASAVFLSAVLVDCIILGFTERFFSHAKKLEAPLTLKNKGVRK